MDQRGLQLAEWVRLLNHNKLWLREMPTFIYNVEYDEKKMSFLSFYATFVKENYFMNG